MATSLMQEKTFLLPNLDVLKHLWKDGCEGLVVRMGHSSLGRRNLNQEMYHRVSRIRRDPQESLIVASGSNYRITWEMSVLLMESRGGFKLDLVVLIFCRKTRRPNGHLDALPDQRKIYG